VSNDEKSKTNARDWLAADIKKNTNLDSEKAHQKAAEIAREADRKKREERR